MNRTSEKREVGENEKNVPWVVSPYAKFQIWLWCELREKYELNFETFEIEINKIVNRKKRRLLYSNIDQLKYNYEFEENREKMYKSKFFRL